MLSLFFFFFSIYFWLIQVNLQNLNDFSTIILLSTNKKLSTTNAKQESITNKYTNEIRIKKS